MFDPRWDFERRKWILCFYTYYLIRKLRNQLPDFKEHSDILLNQLLVIIHKLLRWSLKQFRNFFCFFSIICFELHEHIEILKDIQGHNLIVQLIQQDILHLFGEVQLVILDKSCDIFTLKLDVIWMFQGYLFHLKDKLLDCRWLIIVLLLERMLNLLIFQLFFWSVELCR